MEFYRPAVHVMRRLKEEGKLSEHESIFFEPHKQPEELYNLVEDPQELNNLVNKPECAKLLKDLRKMIVQYDKKMKPVSNIYHPVHANAVDLLEWVKKDRPELYQQMLDGVEIGFQTLSKEYKGVK
nr:sulfatase/phosphatase domain-containing protein [Arenibacter algicola]